MRACWAACLGDCAEQISGEHIITNGVFLTDSVKVKGLPWCPEFKTIGLASLVKNVLCVRHNSQLSTADVGAIQLREAICDTAGLSEARNLMATGKSWPIERFRVNGFAVERWCLKTLITIAFGGQVPIGAGEVPGKPSRELVETAFGVREFEPPRAGLHWMGKAGDTVSATEGVVVTTFSDNTQRLAGARFWFWGLNLLLLLNDGVCGPFSFVSSDGKQKIEPNTVYRPRGLNIQVLNRPSHVLEFVW
jgi:hypothetical protein